MTTPRTLFHGTAFCTLYIMAQMKEPSLLSYGDLSSQAIPCFVGECQRGIHTTGVNHHGTSWTSDFEAATRYAKAYFKAAPGAARHTLEDSKELIESIISAANYPSDSVQFYYPREEYEWEKRILAIRRLRAYDDTHFQSTYQEQLAQWCITVRKRLNAYLEDPSQSAQAQGRQLLACYDKFIETMNKKLTFSAITPAARAHLNDQTPIIFEMHDPEECTAFERGEYLVKSPVRLGTQIKTIHTDSKSVQKVEQFLADNHVQGISVKSLPETGAILSRITTSIPSKEQPIIHQPPAPPVPTKEIIDPEKQSILDAISEQIKSLSTATDETSQKKKVLLAALRSDLENFSEYGDWKKIQNFRTKYSDVKSTTLGVAESYKFNRSGYKLGAMIWQRTVNPKTKTRELIDRTNAFLEKRYNTIHHYEHATYR